MATYKVIQDVEAEDKLLGPLTLRQFIYAGITAACLYISYLLASHGLGFMTAVFLPMAAVSGFFAFPWGGDQPTEIWALAKIRFYLKPRKRIWNQSGIKELVTITAPKHLETNFTNGLSETEVKSRLRALADTIDSRGWAIKNANLNLYTQMPQVITQPGSDRLVGPAALPQPVESVEIQAADDMLDEKNNASAQRLNTMIDQSAKAHRQKIVEDLSNDTPAPQPKPNNYWFLNQPAPTANIPNNMVTFNTQVVTPGTPEGDVAAPIEPIKDEASLVAELDARKQTMPTATYYGHMRTIQPLSAQASQQQQAAAPPVVQDPAQQQPPMAPLPPITTAPPVQPPPISVPAAPVPPPVTPATQAAILQLASNDDLNVATIAREVGRTNAMQNEVVIKLH